MGKDPSYPMYAQDFDMDTASWTVAEIGAYVRLLNYEWINGELPNNISHLARIARVDSRTMHKMWSTVIAKKFLTNDANMLVNRRMEEERDKRDKYHEIQREKGKTGADKRWHKDIADAMPVLCPEDKPEDSFSFSSSLTTKKNKKPVSKKLTDDEYFDVLKNNPAYKGIDIDREQAKCEAWCLTNGKVFSRRRLVNWLNRVERPMTIDRPIGYNGRPKEDSALEKMKQEDRERELRPPSPEHMAKVAELVANIGKKMDIKEAL